MQSELFVIAVFLWTYISSDCSNPNNLCAWQEWAPWSKCSVSCGGGSRTRVRPICCAHDATFSTCMDQCGLTENDIIVGFSERDHNCSTVCYNGGTYSYGRCRCSDEFYGMCCSYAYVNDVVIVGGDIVAKEGTCVKVACHTSISRPIPLVMWYLDKGTDDVIDDVRATGQATQTPEPGFDELSVVTGNLKFNVSRSMNGWQMYCEANNIQSSRLTLDILFPAVVEEFVEVVTNATFGIVEVNESDKVVFKCTVNSNPSSEIVILKGNDELRRVREAFVSSHKIKEVTCMDSGVYTCQARNLHNKDNETSSENLELIVKCVPRLSPMHQTSLLYNATVNDTVTLTIPVLAYPFPLYSNWLKQKESNWIDTMHARSLANSSKPDLVTEYSLTIPNIQLSDFGNYQLCVANELKETCIHASLEDQDKNMISDSLITTFSPLLPPSPPTNLSIVHGMFNSSTAMISWLPGFDGGVDQTFIVLYRKENEHSWTKIEINSTHEGVINTTIQALAGKTRYLLQMFANNNFGNSSSVEIVFETPDLRQVRYVHSRIPVYEIAWVVSVILLTSSVVVMILFVILKVRQRLKSRTIT